MDHHLTSAGGDTSTSTSTTTITKPIHCIVKLGGAAITCKNELETINEENLKIVSSQLSASNDFGPCQGMDWSRRPGSSEIPTLIDDFNEQLILDSKKFVVVHGSGSFGHFQASKTGVHKSGLSRPIVKSGFVATRISVTSLNLEIVRALAKVGGAIDSGFIPVSGNG